MDDIDSVDDNELDEDNHFCTQGDGDNKESFTFGSQAGLCTQMRNSQDFSDSDDDEDMENVGVALGIQDEHDCTSFDGKDSARDEEVGKERPSDSYSPKIYYNNDINTNLGETIYTKEIDCSQKGQSQSSKNNNADGNSKISGDCKDFVSEHTRSLEYDVDAAAEDESEEQHSRKKIECSEATLLFEDSLSQSPLKLGPARFDQEDDPGNIDDEATGFTENDECSDEPDTSIMAIDVAVNGSKVMGEDPSASEDKKAHEDEATGFTENNHCSDEPDTSIMAIDVNGNKVMGEEPSASEDKKAHEDTLGVELGEIQPGFTEDTHTENAHSDEPDTSIMAIDVNGNKVMGGEPSATEDKKPHEDTLGVAELGEIQPGFTEDTQSQIQSQNGGENVEHTPSVTEPIEEKVEASPGEVKHLPRAIVIKSGADASAMASKSNEVLQQTAKEIVQNENSAFINDDNFYDDGHDNHNEQKQTYLQYPPETLFAGDTQSIPSQFPLTLEDKGGDPDAEHYTPKQESRSTEGMNSLISSHASTSLKSPLRYTDDSFCAGSTEKITDETATATSVPHEKRSGRRVDVCSTLNFDSEVADFESPSKQESQNPLGDGKEANRAVEPSNDNPLGDGKKANRVVEPSNDNPLGDGKEANRVVELWNDNTLKGTSENSILNLRSTPHDDYLSYPKDFLSNKSSGTETLSTTPQSQILLESTVHKKPIFFAVDKLSNRRTAATSKADDAIENSSDEENEDEIVDDPSQNNKDDSQQQRMEMTDSVKKASLKSGVSMQPISTNGWLETNRNRTQGGKRIDTKCDSSLSNEKEQIASADIIPKPTGLSECESDDDDDFVKNSKKNSSSSCLIDTQDETGDEFDDEDDKPLTHLRNLKKGIPASRYAAGDESSTSSSSEEENEFNDEENYIEPSQNTRAIKSQLQKLENFDVKTLTEKLLKAPVGQNAELKKHITELTAENTELQKASKRLAKEKESMRKQLLAANVQLKGKIALIDQMRKKLDEYKPLLDAVQKISESNDTAKTTKSGRSPKSKLKKSHPVDKRKVSPVPQKSRRAKSSAKKVVESDEDKEVYTTPEQKKAVASKEKVSIVSVSNRKIKRKSKIGDMTFGNLWKILKTEHGWKYKNAPIPFAGQVYVPPNGSVEVGAKAGVDFFEADDLLWKMAEHLGIIDSSQVNSQEDFEAKDGQRNVPSIKGRRDTLSKADMPRGQMEKDVNRTAPQTLIPVVEEGVSESEEEKELDNSKLYGKLGTLTEASLNRCCCLLREFLQLRTKGIFMRHLFGPIWHCLNNSQGAIDKDIAWRYCKSKSDNLGSTYWFCPPQSKGSNGEYGIDYFTTEEAVVSHVLREVKEYQSFDMEGVPDLEIKLSRAIEQHIPFDEIKNASASDTRLGTRRIVSNEISSKTKSSSPRQSKRTIDDTRSVVSTVSDTTIKTRNKSPMVHPPKKQCVDSKTAKSVTFSQNTMEGAEILMNLNKSEYENMATPLGINELLKFRRRATKKRKAEEKKEDRSPRKREKLSPAAMCHLTQNPDDAHSVSFQSPQPRRVKSADKKCLPLYELLFFGSGVTDEIKIAVNRLGGTYLNDVSGNYLREETVGKKMFFLSDVKFRRTHKYILASALGVPMLNFEWVTALETQFIEVQKKGGKTLSAFDSRLYSRHR